MRIRLSHVILIVGGFLLCVLDANTVRAQEMQCQQELGQANALYTTGRFDDAIVRIDACLEKEGLSDIERRTAYRLKGLSFIGKGIEVDAKASVRRLMELFPNYQPDPVQDPPDFVAMVNEIKEEVNQELAEQELAEQEEEQTPEETEEPETTVNEPPVTQPSPEPITQVTKKKKKGAGRFLLIGGGVAATVGVIALISGPDGGGGGGGGVEISDPPGLPN